MPGSQKHNIKWEKLVAKLYIEYNLFVTLFMGIQPIFQVATVYVKAKWNDWNNTHISPVMCA